MDNGVPHVVTGTIREYTYSSILTSEETFYYLEVGSTKEHWPSTTDPHYTIPEGYEYTYWDNIMHSSFDYGEQFCTMGIVWERYPIGDFDYVRVKLLEGHVRPYPFPIRLSDGQEGLDQGAIAIFCGTKRQRSTSSDFSLHPDDHIDSRLVNYLDTTEADRPILLQGTQSQIVRHEPSSDSSLDVGLGSPADLHIYDSRGNHVGVVYDGTGSVVGSENEIPDATYFYGAGETPEIVSMVCVNDFETTRPRI